MGSKRFTVKESDLEIDHMFGILLTKLEQEPGYQAIIKSDAFHSTGTEKRETDYFLRCPPEYVRRRTGNAGNPLKTLTKWSELVIMDNSGFDDIVLKIKFFLKGE